MGTRRKTQSLTKSGIRLALSYALDTHIVIHNSLLFAFIFGVRYNLCVNEFLINTLTSENSPHFKNFFEGNVRRKFDASLKEVFLFYIRGERELWSELKKVHK